MKTPCAVVLLQRFRDFMLKLTPKLKSYFSDYAAYHKTKGNQITHYVGIPSILFSIFGLGALVPVMGPVHLGFVVWLLASLFYLRLQLSLGLVFSLVNLGLVFVAQEVNTTILWCLFVGGWIVQFIGHYVFEKKSPAFYKNLTHLLIGPIWIFYKLLPLKK